MSVIVETSFFGNLTQAEDPKVLIIPTPYEYTTSSGKGTKNAPQAILNASKHLNFFDDELWIEISKIGINTSNFVTCEFVNNKSKQPFSEIEEVVRNSVIAGSLPVVIGGEHSLSYGAIKAIYDLYDDISILHLSAHTDLKSTFQSNKFDHSCIMRRILELMPDIKLVQIGIRNLSKEEASYIEAESSNVEVFFGKDKKHWNTAEILTNLTKNVYITFDFSVFEVGIMQAATRPDPGGLSWAQVTDILKNVCTFKEIVGMDFVEFAPIPSLIASDFLAARLILKSIGYTFARQLGVFEDGAETRLTASPH